MGDVLHPLPYHQQLRDYLKTREAELWRWFASAESEADSANQVRMELLKHTYRLDRDGHGELYALLDDVKRALQLEQLPVTVYQSQHTGEQTAALLYTPGEGHIVLLGSIMELLSSEELKALFGHELAHFLLWQGFAGEFLLADRVITAMANDLRAENSHLASARLYQLYTEIFCDRGALHVVADAHVVIAMLVKVSTGLATVHPESYLRQAEEILAQPDSKTEGVTHPELFIRARAIALYARQHTATSPAEQVNPLIDVDSEVTRMLEGAPTLDTLDLVGQVHMTALTRRFLCRLLAVPWMCTEVVLAHMKLFFPEIQAHEFGVDDPALAEDIRIADDKLQEYFCYLLLDFATIDPELDEAAIAAVMQLAEQCGLAEWLDKLLAKELKMPKRTLTRLHGEKDKILQRAATAAQEASHV